MKYEIRDMRYPIPDTLSFRASSIEIPVIYVPIRHLYNCRDSSTNQPFLCKTNPILCVFHLKTPISPKNKANSNPIKAKTNPIKAKTNPIQSQFKANLSKDHLKEQSGFILCIYRRLRIKMQIGAMKKQTIERILEANIMKKYLISIITVLTILAITQGTFAQEKESPGQSVLQQRENMRQRLQNMSEADREKFMAEMQKRRERFQNMSEEERQKLRAEMQQRFGGRISLSREDQLKAISAIEQQVAKLKAAILSIEPQDRARLRDLSEEQRSKLREKNIKAARERMTTIRAIEQQLAKLRGPGRPQQRPERLDRPQRQLPDVSSSAIRAPGFKLSSFGGKTVSLSDYRGKTVVLEWFNMECPFSLYHYKTKNTMASLANKYKSKNVVWLAVNSTNHTTPAANKKFTEKHKLSFPILDDRSGKVGRAYGAKTTPHIFVINPRGRIVYDGAIDDSPMGKKKEGVVNYVDNVLAELTAGKAVSVSNTKSYGCTVKYATK
jgi:peroxiredoxin